MSVLRKLLPTLRDHPFKTSACLRGGGSPLPMFADARGVGVLEKPTSAIQSTVYTSHRYGDNFLTFVK